MLYYPQLTTGSLAQYPISRNNQRRTITNRLADGSDIRTTDPGFAQVRWDLSYTNLTAAELAQIESLFEASEGQLGTFTFLDPTDNLLNWTEDFTQSVWTIDPLLTTTPGMADPLGGGAATQVTNTAQAGQGLSQTIAAASWFQYCFSVYLRADAPCIVTMSASCTQAVMQTLVPVGPSWTRAVCSYMLAPQQNGITFALEIPAGCRADVFGPQVEAQFGAGSYKQATSLAGVYPHSRFNSDQLTGTATGPDQYSCKLSVISCTAG